VALEAQLDALPPEKRKALAEVPDIKQRIGATCALTPRQVEADALLDGPAAHVMLFGGSRSGKTFLIMRKIVGRALAHKSRHAVLRFRFQHVVTTIAMDTLPKVMELCYPGAIAGSHLDKSLWLCQPPNGSEIWFGGLDEKGAHRENSGQRVRLDLPE
jgi:hypothetical protein